MEYFPQNTVANFITHLSRPVQLEGNWEVAVVEVYYPCSLLTLCENSMIYIHAYPKEKYEQVKTKAWESESEPDFTSIVPTLEIATLTPGDYTDVKEVVDMINSHEVVRETAYFNYDEQTKELKSQGSLTLSRLSYLTNWHFSSDIAPGKLI